MSNARLPATARAHSNRATHHKVVETRFWAAKIAKFRFFDEKCDFFDFRREECMCVQLVHWDLEVRAAPRLSTYELGQHQLLFLPPTGCMQSELCINFIDQQMHFAVQKLD